MRRATDRGVGWSGIAATLAALAVIGCARSPREQAKKGFESLHSWAVSTRMVAERWVQGSVPDPYAVKALQSFGKQVRKERKKAASGKLPADVRRILVAQYDSTAVATDSLLMLAGRGQKRAAASIVVRLSDQARVADSLKGWLGAR